ncbi:hypothetical protein DENIT_20137 [Pseudomonas veronii]|uniref:hypothetical protein n=1 Tax=Pseudomonas veronii TaxID=76761 RepID=UPI00176E1562|nr:hypothetical protein [Pseudomonas veronii]CAD0264248.1 hypothetical protein DENIT_20137 [Pseudomonas veronii]
MARVQQLERIEAFATIPGLREKWRNGEASGDEIRLCKALMDEKEEHEAKECRRARLKFLLLLWVPTIAAVIAGGMFFRDAFSTGGI